MENGQNILENSQKSSDSLNAPFPLVDLVNQKRFEISNFEAENQLEVPGAMDIEHRDEFIDCIQEDQIDDYYILLRIKDPKKMDLILKYQDQIQDESLWYNEDSRISFFSRQEGHLGTIMNLREGFYTFGISIFGNCTIEINLDPNFSAFSKILSSARSSQIQNKDNSHTNTSNHQSMSSKSVSLRWFNPLLFENINLKSYPSKFVKLGEFSWESESDQQENYDDGRNQEIASSDIKNSQLISSLNNYKYQEYNATPHFLSCI